MRIFPTAGWKFAIIRGRQFKTLCSTHRFGYRWNVGSCIGKTHYEVKNVPMGASSFVVLLGILQPHREHGGGLCPLSLP